MQESEPMADSWVNSNHSLEENKMQTDDLRIVARKLLRTYQVRSTRSRNLALALGKGQEKVWAQGDLMCGEGQPSDSMFVTMEGSVQVLKRDTTGTEKELAVIPSPSMIGQMGLVDGSARSATCRAASAIKGILISKQTFNSLLQEQSPEGSAFQALADQYHDGTTQFCQ